MEFQAVFSVKKEIEKDEFLRELLVSLGKHGDTPVDVVNAQIGEVRESVKEVLLCSVDVTGTCTASIGYDRKEAYTDYENYKEKVGDSYVTRQRPVTKYRTVTDWSPFSIDFAGEETVAEPNGSIGAYSGSLAWMLRTISKNSISLEGEATVDSYSLSLAIMRAEACVKADKVKFPGDHHKDKNYQVSSNVTHLTCYKLPFYEVTFTYNGTEYNACGFACGACYVHHDVPEEVLEEINPEDDIKAEAKVITQALEQKSKVTWLVFFGALGVSALFCYLLKFGWLWPIVVGALVYAIITNKKYNEEYKKCTDALALGYAITTSLAQATHLKAKIDALNQTLAYYGYPELTPEETPKIDGESDAVVTKNLPKVAAPKSYKVKAILSAILSVILVISSFVVNDKVRHSPKQVEIEIVDKRVEFNPDEHMYGNYYIHLDFEVTAKKVSFDYIDLIVYISDDDGRDLGTVKASLSSRTIEAGETRTITVSLEENQPERNQFFTTLYNADFSDLNFKYEIQSIGFSDGKYYNIES